MLRLTDVKNWQDCIGQVVCGNNREVLAALPAESINCCISSPPYWGLRDYGIEPTVWDGKECEHKWQDNSYVRNNDQTAGQKQNTNTGSVGRDEPVQSAFCSLCGAWRGCLGLEPTIELFIKHLCDIYDGVKRVLRKDGCCFVNLGDSYAGSGKGAWDNKDVQKEVYVPDKKPFQIEELPAKSLCLIPERFAIEMVNRGWILRNKIVWHKPNPMPSSASDRFTVDFENVFFFVKSQRYWFEQQFEPHTSVPFFIAPKNQDYGRPDGYTRPPSDAYGALGRNMRTTWTIPTGAAGGGVHFATFPKKLVEPMVKAGCPEYICNKCGKPREKIYQTKDIKRPRLNPTTEPCEDRGQSPNDYGGKEIISFEYSDCGCNAGFRKGIVLDIFAGLSTVASVAYKLDRDFIMIDLKQQYCSIGEKRLLKERAQGKFEFGGTVKAVKHND